MNYTFTAMKRPLSVDDGNGGDDHWGGPARARVATMGRPARVRVDQLTGARAMDTGG